MLSVVCVDNLKQAIDIVNSSEYGLTSGLQSLDEKEQLLWKNSIEAGNLYINRGITGAIVNRQPFGGMKRSAFGGGIKAGGRNYVSNFVQIVENKDFQLVDSEIKAFASLAVNLESDEKLRFQTAVDSYQRNWENEFSQERDIQHLLGERNTFRYLPLKNMALRIQSNDNLLDIMMIIAASMTVKTLLTISISENDPKSELIKKSIGNKGVIRIQSEANFLTKMDTYERIRTCNNELSAAFVSKAAILGTYVASAKPLIEGRIELLHYVKEQSIAFEYHRYGSITDVMD
jgi:RHH-type proline utilization regulon transcriptional repressor/proline dehydrogenase/delta 1-pyrroline-5-carboxylate dehydrogenase